MITTILLLKSEKSKYPANSEEIINQFIKTLKSWRWMTKEHRDYVLIKELYHCTPSDLDEQDETVLQLHFKMLQEERKHEFVEQKRAEQKAKMQALSNKK